MANKKAELRREQLLKLGEKKDRLQKAEGAYVEVGERTEIQKVDHGEAAYSMIEETAQLRRRFLRLKREVERDTEKLRKRR